jgi:isopenicillin N synthase-like dioxygenase
MTPIELPAPTAVGAGTIPVISLAGADRPGRREELAAELGEALRRHGFYVIVDHDVPRGLFDELHSTALRFFRQPEEAKRRYAPSPADLTRRGWTTRFRAGARLGSGPEVDTAESFTLNPYDPTLGWRPVSALPLALRRALLHRTPWPEDRFRRAALPYFLAMESQLRGLLALHAVDLGLPSDYFTRLCADSLTNMAVNYYPPLDNQPNPELGCLGPHTDLGIMTALMHSGQPGLQVVDRSAPDRWIEVPTGRDDPRLTDAIVVNAGDELALATGGRYQSALHRVVCPDRTERMSIPVFMQPAPATEVRPAPSLPPPPGAAGYQPVNAWRFFCQRMGLMYEPD